MTPKLVLESSPEFARGAVRVLTLNRPEVRNALSQALQASLTNALNAALADETVRVVVITGAGRAFCAGLDLAELAQLSSRSTEENRRDSQAFASLLATLYSCSKPVIAAVNGHAVAGGAGIASVCDMVVMSEDARIGYTESKIGFVAALVGVYLLRSVGEKHARELLLGARPVSAQEALEMGLVNRVVTADEVLPRTLALAAEIAQNAPSSLAMTKQLLAAAPGMGLQEATRYAVELNALARTTDNLKEGVQAFLDKRDPHWHS